MNKKLILAVIIFPLLGMSGLIAKSEYDISKALTWRVKIQGFDPRSLLYGRYIHFQYNWDWESETAKEACPATEPACCLCLKGSLDAPKASTMACQNTSTQCISTIPFKINHADSRKYMRLEDLLQLPTRYYIPEESAPMLDELFRERGPDVTHSFSIDLRLTPSGAPFLTNLYINNTPWRDWLKTPVPNSLPK